MPHVHLELRPFLEELRGEGELFEIDAEVDPDLELAEIHRRVIAAGGPALLFRRPRGSRFPIVTNLFGTRGRVERAFGRRPRELIEEAARLPVDLMPPTARSLWGKRGLLLQLSRIGLERLSGGPVTEVVRTEPLLGELPATKSWPRDGGRFLTLPLVYTEHPETGASNLGVYRIQIFDDTSAGLHVQIGKGGGFHLAAAEARGQALPVNIHLGGPPALMLAAIAPLPENVPEVLLASLLLGRRLRVCHNPAGSLPLLADAELALVGEVAPGARHPEGPFGDHYGSYSETHDYPLFSCRALLRRREPILPATVVGKPRQEDFYLGDYLQELLAPLFPIVMSGVRDLWSYGETGFHPLAAAIVRERYKREAMASAFRILGEGQLSLTKFLLVTNESVDLRDFRATLTHVLARADFRTDLFLFANLSMDSLDYSGRTVNEGSKGVLLGIGDPVRDLPGEFTGAPRGGVEKVRVFAPGCLVVEGPRFDREPDCGSRIAADPAFADWPLLVLSDDVDRAVRSSINFLWTTFTRFDPAADVHAAAADLVSNHAVLTPPILIDARLKPWYPEELFCDVETAGRVTDRWSEYFGGQVEMGDSDRAHLD